MKCLLDHEHESLMRRIDPTDVLAAARALIAEAQRQGLVLTIEQVPLQPLAMGHYETVAGVRPARTKA